MSLVEAATLDSFIGEGVTNSKKLRVGSNDRQCHLCGRTFQVVQMTQVFCSYKCKWRSFGNSPKRQLYLERNRERIKTRHREYNERNRERLRAWHAKYHTEYTSKYKMAVYKHYSPELRCQKCGFDDIRALSIDHVNGGGRNKTAYKERGGVKLYKWIVHNNYPADFQILCMNCQWIKRIERQEMRRPR